MSVYELAILGSPSPEERQDVTDEIAAMVGDFGLALGSDVVLHDRSSIQNRDRRAAFAATYFGGLPQLDVEATRRIVADSAPVIPTVAESGDFRLDLPGFLHPSQGLRRRPDAASLTELAIALLECVGLLRNQRRVFISYRRREARNAATHMHDVLSERGFDVFLDTHDVKYGTNFQQELWHNLCDSDLMLMFDTPEYFESKWTRQEVGRARAKGIHVLRAIWPGHKPVEAFSLSETIFLSGADLLGADGPLSTGAADRIAIAVERLRSRSVAARYLAITGKLRAEIEGIGATIAGIGAHRAMLVELSRDRRLWAYPIVGIPSAQVLHDIVLKAQRANRQERTALVYDEVGIGEPWKQHISWLRDNIATVEIIKVHEAGWALAGVET